LTGVCVFNVIGIVIFVYVDMRKCTSPVYLYWCEYAQVYCGHVYLYTCDECLY